MSILNRKISRFFGLLSHYVPDILIYHCVIRFVAFCSEGLTEKEIEQITLLKGISIWRDSEKSC